MQDNFLSGVLEPQLSSVSLGQLDGEHKVDDHGLSGQEPYLVRHEDVVPAL